MIPFLLRDERPASVWAPAIAGLLVLGIVAAPACHRREQPPYDSRAALDTFQLPAGFHIEVAAAEPQVQDPIAMAFDERGRLFVVELPDYPLGQANGRIKLLEDRDGDGRFETSTIFADGLHFPTGVLPVKGGVLVTAAPDILSLTDTDGDNRADTRRVVLTGFAVTNPQLRVNGLLYGLDNWIYVSYPRVLRPQRYAKEFGDRGSPIRFPDHPDVPPVDALAKGTDLRFRMDPAGLEAVAGTGQFGNAFDAWGDRFTVWNNDHIRHVVMPQRYVSANPSLAVRSPMQSISDHGNAAPVFSITRQPMNIHESEIGHFTSACGISVAEGGTFPPGYQGSVFMCDPVHNLVHADRLTAAGATFTASRAVENHEFLASTDSWFRPVFTTTGPDGAMYVADFYRKLVEHPEWLPPDLMKPADLTAGNGLGRIYRIVYGGSRPAAAPVRLGDATSSQLVAELGNANLWRRTMAQRLLVDRQDRSVVPALQAMLGTASPAPALARLHALWTLDGLGALDMATVLAALDDGHPGIREQAVRLAERHLSDAGVVARLLRLDADPSDRVQFQLACTLAQVPAPGRDVLDVLERLALGHIEDPWFQTAVLTGPSETGRGWWTRLTAGPEFTATRSAGREEFLRRVASVIGSRRDAAGIEAVLHTVGQARATAPDWWQRAGLDGVAAGLRHGAEAVQLAPPVQNQLLALLQTGSAERRRSALDLSRSLTLSESPALRRLLTSASRQALQASATPEARADAAGLLGLDPTTAPLPALDALLSPQQPEPVQRAAAATLLSRRDGGATAILLNRWPEYSGAVRELVVGGFFGSRQRVIALLDAIETGTLPAASLPRARSAQLRTYPDPDIRRRAQALLPGALDGDRTAVFEKYRGALKLTGNGQHGREIYVATCSQCHRLGQTGFEVGPDLAGVASRDRENLLLQIVDPNASIVAGYEQYLIETVDGRSITGIIAHRTDSAVTVRRAGGGEDTVLRASILRLRALTLSPMPEGLEAAITLQGMSDLLAYLKSLGTTK